MVTIEIDPLMAEYLLPDALAHTLELYGSAMQVRLVPIRYESVRKNVATHSSSIGVGFATQAEEVGANEMLGPKIPFVLVIPETHRLRSVEPVPGDSLTLNDRVFLPEMASESVGMDEFLKSVPKHNRIECEATVAVFSAMANLGVGIVPDVLPARKLLSKRVIQAVEWLQPRFVLPRNLNEPEQSLVEHIRKVVESRSKQEAPAPEAVKDAEEIVEALVEEAAIPLEGVLP